MLSKKYIGFLVLAVSSIYVILLWAQKNLDLYIHPRYITFTITMAIICAILILISTASSRPHAHKNSILSMTPIILILVGAILLPPSSLSSATVSQRAVSEISSANQTNQQSISTLFSGSSRALSLNDWARLLESNTDEGYYANKSAKISGFVYDAGLGPNTVWLARFVLTCCAVDAQPVGIPVNIDGWSSKYSEDQWLEIEGTFKKASSPSEERLVLVPDSITEINEPDNPYGN